MGRPKEFDPDVALDHAIEVFRIHGFEASSTRMLTKAMRIGRGSLYESFGTKDDLFLAALERYRQRAFGHMCSGLDSSTSPLETVRAIFRSLARSHASGNKHGCLMVNCTVELGAHDADVAAFVGEGWSQLEDAFARALSKAQKQGELANEKSPRALARFLITIMRGMGVGTKLGIKRTAATDIVSVAMSVLD